MNSLQVFLFDGCSPTALTLRAIPETIQELIEAIAREFPERGEKLLERSFSDEFIQEYTFILNKVHVISRDQKIGHDDTVVIMNSIAGG